MTEHDTLVFLLSLAAMLASARLLGEVARWLGMPLVVGEIAAGILLGPTALGRLAPGVRAWLFPSGAPQAMLGGYTSVAVVLLLVAVGVEVDLGLLRRRGRSAALTGALGIALPFAAGVILGFLLPDTDLVDPARRTTFAVFLGVALSISALPVIAKTLLDLGLFKTDVGLLVMAAATIDDLTGWLALSLLLGPVRGGAVDLFGFGRTVLIGAAFAAILLVAGRRVMDAVLPRVQRAADAASGRVLSAVILLALIGGAVTQAIGLHAVFGGFVVGLTVGESSRVTERTRGAIEDFVFNVFAPVFFASIGLRVDFAAAFDVRLVVLVFALATLPKLLGCTVGARLGGMKWGEAAAVGFGMNARGAIGIVLAEVAHEAGLLTDRIFVALVFMALATSLVSGPAMKRLLYGAAPDEDVVTLLRRGAFVSEMHARTPSEAIAELVRALGSLLTGMKRSARDAVLERELVAATGLGDEVAIPHAAVEGLDKPLLALGRSTQGIDFDAPDGRPARFVFLLLIPPKEYETEVRILASIARATFDEKARTDLAAVSGIEEVTRVLSESAKRTRASQRPPPDARPSRREKLPER
ncbi:MAG TPA: cation:proton antiporter [Polyangiaceae bacterium]|jgi:Kef-type K+ transport system membrane component KefB/mannitol/fructose-specific phosphotransferase system IIA component|nr:cation:proton antiporter [Polyangiaceae bacterium]